MTLKRALLRIYLSALFLAAAAGDVVGGVWKPVFNALFAPLVFAMIGAVALLVFCFAIGMLGSGTRR